MSPISPTRIAANLCK